MNSEDLSLASARQATYRLSSATARLGDRTSAAGVLAGHLESDPAWVEGLYLYARILVQQGHSAMACDFLDRAVALAPDRHDLVEARGALNGPGANRVRWFFLLRAGGAGVAVASLLLVATLLARSPQGPSEGMSEDIPQGIITATTTSSSQQGSGSARGIPLPPIPSTLAVDTVAGDVILVPKEQLFSGGTRFSEPGTRAFQDLAALLEDLPPEVHVTLVGHADSVPVRRQLGFTNEDLGADRALAVMRRLVRSTKLGSDRFSLATRGSQPIGRSGSQTGEDIVGRTVVIRLSYRGY